MTLKDLVQTARKARKPYLGVVRKMDPTGITALLDRGADAVETAREAPVAAAMTAAGLPASLAGASRTIETGGSVGDAILDLSPASRLPTMRLMRAGGLMRPAVSMEQLAAAAVAPAEAAYQTGRTAVQAATGTLPQPPSGTALRAASGMTKRARPVSAPAKPEVTTQQVQYAQGAAIGQVLGKRLMGLLQQKNKGASKTKETWWDGDEKRMRTDPIPAGYAERGIKGSGSDALKIFGASEGRASIDAAQQKAAQEYAARREFTATARQTPGGADMLRKQGVTPREILKRVEKSMKKTRAAAGSQPTS